MRLSGHDQATQPAANSLAGTGFIVWFQLSPYGRFPNRAGLQVFDRGDAERMEAAFNNARTTAGRAWRGLPVFVGHPDIDPRTYKDGEKKGAVTLLNPRADGLYVCARMNAAGREIVENDHYSYPSPNWLMEPIPGKPGQFRPVKLVSVGLTNWPNLDVQPLGVTGANELEVPGSNDRSQAVPFLPKEGEGRPYEAMFLRAVDAEMQAAQTTFNEAWGRCLLTHRGTFEAYSRECEAVKAAKLGASAKHRR